MEIRNRVVGHRRVRAGDLVPHELNQRRHPEEQRQALEAIYEEVGFARSLLAYETEGGALKLIDGHLRREIDPDMMVDVEVVDLSEQEVHKMLLTVDPLAGLAKIDQEAQKKLQSLVRTRSPELAMLWHDNKKNSMRLESLRKRQERRRQETAAVPDQFLIIIECHDENEQIELLSELKGRNLKVSGKIA